MLLQLQTAIPVIELNYWLPAKFIPQNKQCPTQMQKTTQLSEAITSNARLRLQILWQKMPTESVVENEGKCL